jgi:GTP-binding protein HflX
MPHPAEKILLVSLVYEPPDPEAKPSFEECARLVTTAGGEVVAQKIFQREHPDAALFFGSGQVAWMKETAARRGVDLVVVDHDLRPGQQRNLEDLLGVRVIDRTQLILDIFAQRAKTFEGKLQVEWAQLSYFLPRLAGKGRVLSRLGGGIGTRGPGETKLEQDRRRLRMRMAAIARQMEALKNTRRQHRRERHAIPLPWISLVGYTNVGKSALLRALTHQSVLVEDKLFATLDLTTRKLILPPEQEVILTDTVGFIRKLPHHLVAAFRGTLEEVVSVDLLLLVADAAHPEWEAQIRVVEQVLAELHAADKSKVLVFNKVDQISIAKRRRLRHQYAEAALVSALTGEGLEDLKTRLASVLSRDWHRLTLRIPYTDAHIRPLIRRRGRIVHEVYRANNMVLTADLPSKVVGLIEEWRKKQKYDKKRGD